MASVAVTNTFVAATTAVASEVNTNFSDLVNYINNRNSGSTSWDAIYTLSASTIPLIADNSSGTQAICSLRDNGSTVFTVVDGGNTGIGTSGPVGRLHVVGASGVTASYILPQGALPDNTDNAGLYVLHQGTAGAGFRVRTDNNITGSYFAHILVNNASTSVPALIVENRGTGSIQRWVGAGGTEYGRFTSDGFFGLGQTPTHRFDVNGASNAIAAQINVQGSLTNNTDNAGLYVLHQGTGGAAFRVRTDSNLTGDYLAHILLNNTSSSATALTVSQYGTGAAQVWQSGASATVRATLTTGLQIGAAPTGGDKGAGTINVSGDIYKNNTAYTNPDYVFEKWATGTIDKFLDKDGAKEYKGLRTIEESEEFARSHYALPLVKEMREKVTDMGLFSGGDAVLASLEEAYLYIYDLNKRLKKLEGIA